MCYTAATATHQTVLLLLLFMVVTVCIGRGAGGGGGACGGAWRAQGELCLRLGQGRRLTWIQRKSPSNSRGCDHTRMCVRLVHIFLFVLRVFRAHREESPVGYDSRGRRVIGGGYISSKVL